MKQLNLYIDLEYCTGCHSCEVACKQENNIPPGINHINVFKVGPRMVGGKLRMDFVPMHCRHCAKAPCIEACPENAITKRSDGIVLINQGLCIGCTACFEVCPFGVIQLNPETNLAQKCTLCVHRVDGGLEPACVRHCPTGCIRFGDVNDLVKVVQKRQAERMAEPLVLSIDNHQISTESKER